MMISEKLYKAREYEVQAQQEHAQVRRPAFHLTPRIGWMNDPNGFSWYKGQYHLFYQYHPYHSHWGPMHWGHAVSTDLLHWTYLPAAMAPDTPSDCDGCFSGSAAELPDGRQLLMYTGVREEAQPDGGRQVVQSQCIAVGDGLNYEKITGNPVITVSDVPGGEWDVPLPEGDAEYRELLMKQDCPGAVDAEKAMHCRCIISPEFRDPKILRMPDGSWRCIAAGGDVLHDGAILSFRSMDALHWSYEGTLLKNWGRYGRMWECPDLFELDGRTVLLVSPQDMLAKEYEYHSGDGTVCFIGHMEEASSAGAGETSREFGRTEAGVDPAPEEGLHPAFCEETSRAVDYGMDFYAPQTILTPDGRRVLIGWMQNWDTSMLHPKERPWFGQMTIPRELSIRDGRFLQQPIRELESLRRNEVRMENLLLEGDLVLDGVRGRTVDLEITLDTAVSDTGDASAVGGCRGSVADLCGREGRVGPACSEWTIHFAEDEHFHTSVTYRPSESLVCVNRVQSGIRRDLVHERCCPVRNREGRLFLRIILDYFSAELFLNDGEQVLSTTLYTSPVSDGISFHADGPVRMSVAKWDLVP